MAKYIKTEKEEPVKPASTKAAPPAYEDSMGITDKKLKWGLWYIEHLKQLKKSYKYFLIAVSVLAWGYFFFGFFHYIFIGMKEDQAVLDGLVNVKSIGHDYFSANKAKDIKIIFVQALNNGSDGSYDLVAEIENPNPRHWAELEYTFTVYGKEIFPRTGFILPGEKKYLVSLSEELSGFPADAQIVFKKVSWHPVKAKEIPDWEQYAREHLDFKINDAKFTTSGSELLSEKLSMANVEFEAVNNSPYNYWSVDFIVLVYQGERIVSASTYGKDNFMSGQSYKIALNWPTSVTSAQRVEVIPELNIFKKDIYIDFTGDSIPAEEKIDQDDYY